MSDEKIKEREWLTILIVIGAIVSVVIFSFIASKTGEFRIKTAMKKAAIASQYGTTSRKVEV